MVFKISPGTGYDPDAQAYITAVEAADGESLETAVKGAINTFVVGCKTDGIWTAIQASCILAGARTLEGALVPLVGTAPTNNNFVTANYDRKTGLLGSGDTAPQRYLGTNRNNNVDPQNNQHMCVYASTAATTSGSGVYAVYIGAGNNGSGSNNIGRLVSNGGFYLRSQTSTNNNPLSTTYPGSSTGFLGMNRSSSANYIFRVNGTNVTFTQTSQVPYSGQIYVFWNGIPGAEVFYNNGRIAFYSTGTSLGLSLLDARVNTLISTYASVIA